MRDSVPIEITRDKQGNHWKLPNYARADDEYQENAREYESTLYVYECEREAPLSARSPNVRVGDDRHGYVHGNESALYGYAHDHDLHSGETTSLQPLVSTQS